MSRPTIQKQIFVPGYGSDYSAVEGYMKLMASIEGPDAFGYVGALNIDIASSSRIYATTGGLLSWPNIYPNSGGQDAITVPANTVYEVTVEIPGQGLTFPEYISVPDSPGPLWVQDILTTPPTSFASTAGKASATATFITSQDETATLSNSTVFYRALTPLTTTTTNYTALTTDSLIRANAAGGSITITLPTAVGVPGRQYQIKRINSSGGTVIVTTTGGQAIDGTSSITLLQQYETLSVMSDNANWMVT